MDPLYERRLSLRGTKIITPPSSPLTPRMKSRTPHRPSSLGKRTHSTLFNTPPTIRRNLNLSPPELSPSKRPVSGDRFIPVRSRPILSSILGITENESHSAQKQTATPSSSQPREPSPESHKEAVTYSCLLRNEILGSDITDLPMTLSQSTDGKCGMSPSRKQSSPSILQFRSSLSRPSSGFCPTASSLSPLTPSSQKLLLSPKRVTRKISKTPFKVLDAPELQDDYYLNLLDWSSSNMLAVGLGTSVYLWNAANSQVNKLHDFQSEGDCVTSVGWAETGTSLCVGTRTGIVSIWDVQTNQRVANYIRHIERVSSLAWKNTTVCSGSRDKSICQWDTRASSGEGPVRQLNFHTQEVCGLRWSADKMHLASGGNDNRLLIWNEHSFAPVHKFVEHRAAIKAIAWSPHQYGLLATGGGTQDKTIRFWNVTTGQQLNHIDTGSQVCNLCWSLHSQEIVSTHGFSQNEILIWRYPSLLQVAKLTGHANRVLYLSLSPDGQTIVTGAGDETLRFWNVFSKACTPKDQCSPLEEAISNSSSFK
ncbi:hypothetical protein LOD99_2815 [Oopsacas minuta]|uniref:CDC20/Fizzy WD40 domain-containing protein n=1 Tax=Oopsacas minuta TaxID=111878 RepID=A0AAV7K1C4_9METZ|nr:hypothetical protein LOD99_2815 [Oopsacas minuta]